MTRARNALIVLFAAVLLAGPASAEVLLLDGFTDGDRLDGDGQEAVWLRAESGSLDIVNDDVSGGLNAGNALQFGASDEWKGFVGLLTTDEGGNDYGAVTLDEVGEALTFTFRFRLLTTPNEDKSFRFGLIYNDGSQAQADDDGDAIDDHGYGARLGIGAGSASTIYRDTSNSSVLTGTGLQDIGDDLGFAIEGQDVHNVSYTLTRTAAGEYTIVLDFDGAQYTRTDGVNGPETFHGVAFASGAGSPDFVIDDASVEYVPEPASLAALLAVAPAVLRRRRNR